jgi:membrane protein
MSGDARHDAPAERALGWWSIVVGTWERIRRDNLSVLAAAAAFYALTSLFPALTALVSIYGLVADRAMVQSEVDTMAGVLPPEAFMLVAGWLKALVEGPATNFGIGLLASLLLATWSVWSATGMLMTAINTCYGDVECRGFVRFNLEALALGATLAVLGAVALALVALLPVLLAALPAPPAWRTVIILVRWPLLAGLAMLGLDIVYRYGPARVAGSWQWISWGAVVATVLWLLGSVGFTEYVARIGSYDRTYGSLGAVIVLLLWFFMSAYVILIGAELNGEMERLQAGRRLSLAEERAADG